MTARRTHAHERVSLAARTDLNLLPEKFRKQLRSAVPFLITNQDATTGAYQIVFTAESWKGVGNSAAWVSGNFIYEKVGTEDATVREMSVPLTYDQELGKYRPINVSLAAINKHGVLAGMIERAIEPASAAQGSGGAASAPSGPSNVPGVILPFEIKSTDVVKGFDPPLAGDVHFDGDPATEDPKDDDLNPREWWTSVCQTPTPGPDRNLNVNNHLQVVFPDASLAASYELVLDPDDGSDTWLTFPPVSPMQAVTNLTITGKANVPGVIGRPKLLLRQIGTTTPQAVIKVMVLPYRKLKLGVWDVNHPGRPGTTVGPHPSGADILNAAKQAFAQVCVSFDGLTAPSGSDPVTWWKIPAAYDTNAANDTFNRATERQAIIGALNPNLAEVNVVIVQNHDNAAGQAFTPYQKAPLSYQQAGNYHPQALGATERFLHEVVHEIGHQLDLSTRAGTPAVPYANHDLGVFPKIIYSGKPVDMFGLMFRRYEQFIPVASEKLSTFWLRHEDWERASVTAKDKTLPWTYNQPPPQP